MAMHHRTARSGSVRQLERRSCVGPERAPRVLCDRDLSPRPWRPPAFVAPSRLVPPSGARGHAPTALDRIRRRVSNVLARRDYLAT
jgi:hypothetical protein